MQLDRPKDHDDKDALDAQPLLSLLDEFPVGKEAEMHGRDKGVEVLSE